jgi:hypothetical protein
MIFSAWAVKTHDRPSLQGYGRFETQNLASLQVVDCMYYFAVNKMHFYFQL